MHGRNCRSPLHWDEVGEKQLIGPDLIQHTVNLTIKIRERMKIAQDTHNSYANTRKGDLEFKNSEH